MKESGTTVTCDFHQSEDKLLVLTASTVLCGSHAVIMNKLKAFYDKIT